MQNFEKADPTLRKYLHQLKVLVDVSHFAQIQNVESEQWLGALLHANDGLVTALMTFEQLDRSIDADSDSEDEAAEQAHLYRSMLWLESHFEFVSYINLSSGN
jgi:hypothetical protein